MRYAVLSDVHGNLAALNAVLKKVAEESVSGILLLGDLIDYCPHSDEVITIVKSLSTEIICNLWGNHEQAIMKNEYERFSSCRGMDCAKHTAKNLEAASKMYIEKEMNESAFSEFCIEDKKCLAVHGSLKDKYWKSIFPYDELDGYAEYDYVFSGHSHLPHYFERFYDTQNAEMRNKKKTIFINPGSVGQPRNHNNRAQFAIVDIANEKVIFEKTDYDILKEQKAFSSEVDVFYKDRLSKGV